MDCLQNLEKTEFVRKVVEDMRLHLFWIDNKWKQNGGCAENYNLIVDMESRTYKFYIKPYNGYYKDEDIEAKRKSDILDYMEYLKKNGFTEVEQI